MELIIPWVSTIWHAHYQSFYPCVSIPILFVSFALVWNESEKDVLHLREECFVQLNRTVRTTIAPKGSHGWIKTYSGDEVEETIADLDGDADILNRMLWANTGFKMWVCTSLEESKSIAM